jgi:hypothetical protein
MSREHVARGSREIALLISVENIWDLKIIYTERSGARNGERRNVQGTYNNVQLPYLSFTERNGEIGRFS